MLKILVITQQQNEQQFWQETISNVWEGQLEITLEKDFENKKNNSDLTILDFSGMPSNTQALLGDFAPNLVGKHFLIVSDKKDADLAIEGIKLGAIGFLVKPFKRHELISCLDRLNTSPTGHLPTRKSAKIISLLSYKGGTGVSTATVNLGYTIANAYQKKILIIDAAGFSNHTTVLLNVIPKCSLADICKQGTNLDEHYLTNAVSNVGKNLSIIGSLTKTSDYNEINTATLENFFQMAQEIYDFILIDTSARSLDELSMFFIQKSSELLLLTTFDLLAIRDNRFFIQMLKEFGILEHRIKPIINRHDWYIGSLEPELVQKQINHPIFHTLPNDWQLCVEAANYGRPLLEFAPNSTLSTSFKILAGKITKLDIVEQETDTPDKLPVNATDKSRKKGILSWF